MKNGEVIKTIKLKFDFFFSSVRLLTVQPIQTYFHKQETMICIS